MAKSEFAFSSLAPVVHFLAKPAGCKVTQPSVATNVSARRHYLEAQIRRLGRRRNLIGGSASGSGSVVAIGGLYLRNASNTMAMSQPVFVAGIVMLAAAALAAAALGWYTLQLNNRITRLSAELTMLEMRG